MVQGDSSNTPYVIAYSGAYATSAPPSSDHLPFSIRVARPFHLVFFLAALTCSGIGFLAPVKEAVSRGLGGQRQSGKEEEEHEARCQWIHALSQTLFYT